MLADALWGTAQRGLRKRCRFGFGNHHDAVELRHHIGLVATAVERPCDIRLHLRAGQRLSEQLGQFCLEKFSAATFERLF